jgi:hypothetical protein
MSNDQGEQTTEPAAPESAAAGAAKASAKPARAKPQKTLPTDRIALPKQVEILRAYGELGQNGGSVTNAAVAGVVGLHPSTTSLANTFFNEIGLLTRAADGQVPSDAVIAFARAHQWNAETAPAKLGPAFANTWFGSALMPKVRFRPHTRSEALSLLADVAGATMSHKGQIEALVELLEVAQLVTIEGDMVKAVRKENDGPDDRQAAPPPPKPSEEQSSGKSSGAGKDAFQISMSVTMAEIGQLPPDKITAFFTGIAEVMKIQAEIEAIRKK